MLVILSEYLMVNTNEIAKATLNKDGNNAWLFMMGESKPLHLEPEEYERLYSAVSSRQSKLVVISPTKKGSNDLKVDYSKLHFFEPIMDDENTCTCGKTKFTDIHLLKVGER